MKKRLLNLLKQVPVWLLFMLPFAAFSQEKVITGTVTDSKDGTPIPGISVSVSGTKRGTVTGTDGTFKIGVPAAATRLAVSGSGFTSQTISIVGQTTVTVSLVAAASTNLDQVVVIGYGSVRRKDVTGAVASVQAKNFNQGIIAAPDQLLQSKVAGVLVTVNSGEPGAGTTVQIRGNSSLRANNNPLYVIDGVPLDGRNAEPGNSVSSALGSSPASNPLLFINPNDIASIDILKDASSAAIYGSRGANGVIAITLKKGTSGPAKLEANVSYGVFAGYMKKFGILNSSQFVSALTKYGAASTLNGGVSVDPLKDITSNTVSQNYSLALSGGNETTKYRASFLGANNAGFVKGTGLGKWIGNFNGTSRFLDKKLTIDYELIVGNVAHNFGFVGNTSGSTGNLLSGALQWNPTTSYKDANGYYVFPTNGTPNPLALIDGVNDKAVTNTVFANIAGTYKILDNLEYKFIYSINHSAGARNINYAGWLTGITGIGGLGIGAIANQLLNSQTFTHTLSYNVDLTKKLHLNALAGYEYWKSDFSNNVFSASGFNTNLTQQTRIGLLYTSILQDGNTQNLPSTYLDPTTELQSYFGRAILNWDDKYLLTATVREDGSSKFGSNNKYGTFPSFAARWNIGNETFMKQSKIFTTLGLRASYGITGNQEFPAGSAEQQYAFSAYNTAGQVNVENQSLKWEQTTATDFGLDFSLLKGRIFGSFDYYHKSTTDLLYQSQAIQPAPATSTWVNLPADLINQGVELQLGAGLVDKKDFSWDLSLNVSYNKNKLTNFNQALILTGQVNGAGVSGAYAQAIANNQPLDVYYLKTFSGYDANGNQQYSANPSFAGDPNPHTTYGVSTTLRYKKIELVINGGGASGYLIFNNTATSVTNVSGILNGKNIDLNAYNSPEKTSSTAGASTRFLENGNFFKLRNSTVRYTIGNAGKYVKNLTAFVSGSNLFVITKFSGFDPEVNIDKSNGGYPSKSIEYVPYPTARTITFGVNFSL